MANIKKHLDNIKGALYGKDVRGSIHDGIDAINKDVENTTGRQVDLEKTFDQLVINAGNSNAEIVDARVKSDGTSYSKLGDRLNEVDSQLEQNVTKLNNFIRVNVRDFGAIGDGLADDTSSIQNAINFIRDNNLSGYGSVYFPSGKYKISSSIEITNNKLSIIGDGFSSIIYAEGTSDNLVSFNIFNLNSTGSASFKLQDIYLFGLNTSASCAGVYGKSAVDVMINNCWFGNLGSAICGNFITLNVSNNIIELCKNVAIRHEDKDFRKVVISNNNFYANGLNHIYIKGKSAEECNNITITGNVLDQGMQINGALLDGGGIEILNCKYFEVSKNIINGFTSSDIKQTKNGIKITNCKKFKIDNVVNSFKANGCYIDNSNSFAISGIYSECGTTGITVVNSNDFEVENVVTKDNIKGMLLSNSNDFNVCCNANSNNLNGIEIMSCSNGFLNVTSKNNNISNETLNGGVAISGSASIPSKFLNISGVIYNSSQFNIRLFQNTNNCKVFNILKNEDLNDTFIDVGSNNSIKL